MTYWQEVKDLMRKGADLAIENIKEGAETAAEKTKSTALATKAKGQILLKHRELAEVFTDLGEIDYTAAKEGNKNAQDPKRLEFIGKADGIIDECKKFAADAGITYEGYGNK